MYDKLKYLEKYHNIDVPNYLVYILKINGKNIYKIGKTNRLKYRLINLKQSLYEDFEIHHTIPCVDNQEALEKERHLHHKYSQYRIKREWFNIPIESPCF